MEGCLKFMLGLCLILVVIGVLFYWPIAALGFIGFLICLVGAVLNKK